MDNDPSSAGTQDPYAAAAAPEDALLTEVLTGLGDRPVDEHVAVFDGLHRGLRDQLADVED